MSSIHSGFTSFFLRLFVKGSFDGKRGEVSTVGFLADQLQTEANRR